jgi:hypothetical protein
VTGRRTALVLGGGAAAVAAAGAIYALRSRLFMAPLAARVRDAALALSPAGVGDPRWDNEVLGGKLGPGRWKYYEKGYGTTCGIFAGAVLARVGAPAALINREPPEGSGFKPGEPISRLYQGARALGWLRVAGRDPLELRPGDVYCVHRPGATYKGAPVSPEHVGIVVNVAGAKITTADGGQTDARGEQCSLRRERTLSGAELATVTGPAKLVWWIRPGGAS